MGRLQVHRDLQWLQANNIMDYSLFVGVRYRGCKATRGQLKHSYQSLPKRPPPALLQRIHFLELARRKAGGLLAVTEAGETVVLYIGMIDILQQYGIVKRVEHVYKGYR